MRRVYWLDKWEGNAKGGYYYRAFDLIEFFKKCEDTVGKVVGIAFEEGEHNLEVILEENNQSSEEKNGD